MLKSKPVPYEPFTPALAGEPERVRAEEVLTSTEIRQRLEARERSVRERLAALRGEVTTLDDITVDGRPLLDHVRAEPIRAVVIAVASGVAVGVAAGALARLIRREEDEEEGVMRLIVASVLDEAALRVAGGEDAATALNRVARKRAPFVQYAPPGPTAKGTLRETFDLAVKSALGFALKAGLDALTQRLTGKPEVLSAAREASENHPGRVA